MRSTTVGILGGGLTGLTLGSLLPDSEVLEKESIVGGLCRSRIVDGFTYDIGGSHVVFSRNKDTLRFIENVLGENIERRTRNAKVFFKGKFVKYPFENGLSDLPPEDNFECLNGYIQSYYARQNQQAPKPTNFEEWMYYRFGQGITEKYLLPYNEKIWKMEAKKMSLRWIEGRIPDPPIEDVIKSSLGIATEGYTHQLQFLYPRTGGIQALTDAIAERCSSIVTDYDIKRIWTEGNQFFVSDSKSEKSFATLVSTIPMPALIKYMVDVPEDVSKCASKLEYNSLISVFLGLSVPKTKDFSWVYFPQSGSLFHRASFPSNYSSAVAPEDNCSVLAEITCHMGDEIWEKKDEALVEHVIERLSELEIINANDVVASDITRMTPAYVIYDSNYDINIRVVEDFLRGYGIETCGRFGQFRYLNMDACIEKAVALSERLK